ncbi:hypothetical protein BU24DRAFT_438734 [Aaosphaeria arxii CBS 175.79]|uniref:Uncharacterized protein n=1 Tax=Aaosphaeria arxii CBS 175.79 TaxID=1450172 RepID=A0A6A5YB34_9PLEO|nr:uncharacterized protein BU24DRAFT_438734 [Aaosphaeria arxii CBS 175.79]KAF2021804.1 hypothetical protein BU24DRAFT_438734 [Aaosphaeria arxii CBS 175.79]
MSQENKTVLRSTTDTIFTFVALYFTTLFSLDTWNAARGSPYRAPGTSTYFRPAAGNPSADSYQGQMYNGGRNGGGARRRDIGRVPTARDSRPPLRMGGTAACGACMS